MRTSLCPELWQGTSSCHRNKCRTPIKPEQSKALHRTRAGDVCSQFGRRWPPASLSLVVGPNTTHNNDHANEHYTHNRSAAGFYREPAARSRHRRPQASDSGHQCRALLAERTERDVHRSVPSALDEAHPWTILTNDYPAASGTNRTLFTHVGVVEYPTGGGGGGGGGGNPLPPEGASSGQDDSDIDSLLINAVSAHAGVEWEVAIFDSQSQYVGSFIGQTTDGQIRVVWNLIDPFRGRRDDPWFDADIYTWWEGGEAAAAAPGSKAEVRMVYGSRSSGRAGLESCSAATTTPPKFASSDWWTGPGNWVVVNQQAFNHLMDHELLDQMTDNFVGAAETRGYVVRPAHPPGEAYRLRTTPLSTATNDWHALRWASIHPTSRNFFYFGRGGRNQIGSSTNALTHISSTQLFNALATADSMATNRHAYRFVFLDGCETAKGICRWHSASLRRSLRWRISPTMGGARALSWAGARPSGLAFSIAFGTTTSTS